MKLKSLLSEIKIEYSNIDFECSVDSVTSDSLRVKKGGIFICIKGTRHDGHDFIKEAIEKGAAVIIAEDIERVPEGVSCVIVKNTRLAEAHIWNNYYEHPAEGMKIIAVTGTNGKTSTVLMLKKIFTDAGRNVGVITTIRSMAGDEVLESYGGSSVSEIAGAMTTPDPEYFYKIIFQMKMHGVDTLVFEASSHALSQYKLDPIHPNIGVFTNLSEEHLDYHGTMQNYFTAKSRLAEISDCCIINADDSYMSRLASPCGKCQKVVTCSADLNSHMHISCDVTALRQRILGVDGIEYIYFSKNAVFQLKSPIPGEFTVYNTLLAAAAAIEQGVPPRTVQRALCELKGIDGRLERVCAENKNIEFSVFIDYAHTPAALETVLKTVRDIRDRSQKVTVLFGCGGDRDKSKRKKMGAIASRLADFVIVTSDNCRSEDPDEIIKEIASGLDKEKPYAIIKDRRDAIEYGIREAGKGDILILAGKGHEKYEIDNEGKKPFDEYAIVKEAIQKYYE